MADGVLEKETDRTRGAALFFFMVHLVAKNRGDEGHRNAEPKYN
jgi:hypothetical protein